MLKPHQLVLLATLLADGGTGSSPSGVSSVDAGKGGIPSSAAAPDAGAIIVTANVSGADAGIVSRKPVIAGGIRWPDDVRTLSTLDGPAVLAAHAALQHLLARFEKEGMAGRCGYSAKGLELVVGEGGGMYIVRINQRMDKCGWVVPSGFSTEMDWFELYAVSLDGRVLTRYPYTP